MNVTAVVWTKTEPIHLNPIKSNLILKMSLRSIKPQQLYLLQTIQISYIKKHTG